MKKSIEYFDQIFRRAVSADVLKLNPFEAQALPYLFGDVLDFGCGMGNLAFAAAAQGCTVTALDASPAAIEHVRSRAAQEHAQVSARLADLSAFPLEHSYDCVVSIGLLMFFDCVTALRVLSQLQQQVRPGGYAVVNVLVTGTTYLDMFDPTEYCLFAPTELQERFADWRLERAELSEFEAPQATRKCFCTVIARKPFAAASPQR